jgi:glycosyltransferase involved in cell wall biosynthesis
MAALGVGRGKAFKRILEECRDKNIKIILVPMAHPWDLWFQDELKMHAIKLIRIIHDAERHPGDLWPRSTDIRKMCRAESVVTLSSFTASRLGKYKAKIFVSCHPELQYVSSIVNSEKENKNFPYDLIIGRQKKYQNTFKVVKWWAKLPENTKMNRKLIVAGKLNFKTRIALVGTKNVSFENRWLSDGDFGNLVSNASRIVCIYKEASQSGIVSAAQSKKVPVLVSNVGGLPEQIEKFGGGRIAALESQADWQSQYESLSSADIFGEKQQSATIIFMQSILESIEFVTQGSH